MDVLMGLIALFVVVAIFYRKSTTKFEIRLERRHRSSDRNDPDESQ